MREIKFRVQVSEELYNCIKQEKEEYRQAMKRAVVELQKEMNRFDEEIMSHRVK